MALARLSIAELPDEANGWLALAALDGEHELEVLEEAISHRPDDRELLGFQLEAALTGQDLTLALDAASRLEELGDSEVATTLGMLRDLLLQQPHHRNRT